MSLLLSVSKQHLVSMECLFALIEMLCFVVQNLWYIYINTYIYMYIYIYIYIYIWYNFKLGFSINQHITKLFFNWGHNKGLRQWAALLDKMMKKHIQFFYVLYILQVNIYEDINMYAALPWKFNSIWLLCFAFVSSTTSTL